MCVCARPSPSGREQSWPCKAPSHARPAHRRPNPTGQAGHGTRDTAAAISGTRSSHAAPGQRSQLGPPPLSAARPPQPTGPGPPRLPGHQGPLPPGLRLNWPPGSAQPVHTSVTRPRVVLEAAAADPPSGSSRKLTGMVLRAPSSCPPLPTPNPARTQPPPGGGTDLCLTPAVSHVGHLRATHRSPEQVSTRTGSRGGQAPTTLPSWGAGGSESPRGHAVW